MIKYPSPLLLILLTVLLFLSGCVTGLEKAESSPETVQLGAPEPSVETVTVGLLKGKKWKYEDSGKNLGTSWKEINFDDDDWDSGPAPLGYSDDDIATEINFGLDEKQKQITSYFRTEFQIPEDQEVATARAKLRCDDGAIVYLNGKEVIRNNLPEKGVNYKTHAVEIVSGEQEKAYQDYDIDGGAVRSGRNVLAVEMHQRGPTSSDLIFDLKMEAGLKPAPKTIKNVGSRSGARLFKRGKIKKPADWTAFKRFPRKASSG